MDKNILTKEEIADLLGPSEAVIAETEIMYLDPITPMLDPIVLAQTVLTLQRTIQHLSQRIYTLENMAPTPNDQDHQEVSTTDSEVDTPQVEPPLDPMLIPVLVPRSRTHKKPKRFHFFN